MSPVATARPFPQAGSEKAQTHFIPKPYDRYYGIDRRVRPTPHPPVAASSGDTSPWPPFAVAAVLLLTVAGAAGARTRRRHRAAA